MATLTADDVSLLERWHPLFTLHERHRVDPTWQPYLWEVGVHVDDIGTIEALQKEFGAADPYPAPLIDKINYAIADDDRDMRWQFRWALALAGDLDAQREVTVAYAHIASETRAIATEMRSRGLEGDIRPLERADVHVETAAALSLGWGAVAGGARSRGVHEGASLHGHAHDLGRDLLGSFWRVPKARRVNLPALSSPSDADSRDSLNIFDEPEAPEEEEEKPSGLTVVPALGAGDDFKGIAIGFRDVVGRSLPYATAPSAEVIRLHRDGLIDTYPHAAEAIDKLLGDLVPDGPIKFRPTLLVGAPGTGKSSLLRLLMDVLLLPYGTLDAATTADQGLVGAPRRWSSAYPSLPLGLIVRHAVANPAVILDELEKAGRSTAGAVTDPLLSLLETHTARSWRDQYLDAEVDLSAVSWLATANAVDGVPRPVLDRLRVLRVPAPSDEHVPSLARTALRDLLTERGVSTRLEPDLDPVELAAVTAAFVTRPARSLRDLRRLVEGVLDARAAAPKH